LIGAEAMFMMKWLSEEPMFTWFLGGYMQDMKWLSEEPMFNWFLGEYNYARYEVVK